VKFIAGSLNVTNLVEAGDVLNTKATDATQIEVAVRMGRGYLSAEGGARSNFLPMQRRGLHSAARHRRRKH